MGLVETTQAGLAREEHTGSDMGYSADLVRYPSERLPVAVLCNDDAIDSGQLAQRVASVFLPQIANVASTPASTAPDVDDSAAKLPRLEPPRRAAAGAAPSIPDRFLDAACGAYYDATFHGVRALRRDGASLVMSTGLGPNAPAMPLEAIDARTFVEKGGDPATQYVIDEAKKTLTRVHPYGDTLRYDRFEPIAIAASVLAEYAGRYTSDEVLQDKEIAVRDGGLVFGTWGRARGATPLSPVKRDLFAGEGGLPFAVAIAFKRDAKGIVRGFTMIGDGVQIEFRKRSSAAD
jgi:hypothetical protein